MAERITTARPYAKAIFALARQSNRLAETSSALIRAAETVTDPRVHALLGSPHVTPAQLAELVTGIAGPGPNGSGLDENGRNFVSLLAQNRRLGFLPEIAALFEQMKAEVENVVDVEVSSATALSPDQESRYAAALQKKLGRSVRLRTRIDQGLLGGAVLKAGDLVIDGSIRGRLERLATDLTA
jgi:F-type H+-transporting ATPase subunit delta